MAVREKTKKKYLRILDTLHKDCMSEPRKPIHFLNTIKGMGGNPNLFYVLKEKELVISKDDKTYEWDTSEPNLMIAEALIEMTNKKSNKSYEVKNSVVQEEDQKTNGIWVGWDGTSEDTEEETTEYRCTTPLPRVEMEIPIDSEAKEEYAESTEVNILWGLITYKKSKK